MTIIYAEDLSIFVLYPGPEAAKDPKFNMDEFKKTDPVQKCNDWVKGVKENDWKPPGEEATPAPATNHFAVVWYTDSA